MGESGYGEHGTNFLQWLISMFSLETLQSGPKYLVLASIFIKEATISLKEQVMGTNEVSLS